MLLQYEDMERERELEEVELQHFGHQLIGMTEFYMQFIPIDSEETRQRLIHLHDIGVAIVRKDYHLLMNDPHVVQSTTDKSLNEYQMDLFETYADQHFTGKPF